MDTALFMLIIMSFFALTWLFVVLALYFVPVIIAYIRRHNNTFPILLLTLFLGWTFFGWLAAVLWSLNSDIKEKAEED